MKIKCYKALSSFKHVYFAFRISGQSSSLKATSYTGSNLSIYFDYFSIKICLLIARAYVRYYKYVSYCLLSLLFSHLLVDMLAKVQFNSCSKLPPFSMDIIIITKLSKCLFKLSNTSHRKINNQFLNNST